MLPLGTAEVMPTAEIVRTEATTVADRLPHRVDAIDMADVRRALERFLPTIATMIVLGRIIDEALGGAG